jgi:hypothetical protein
MRASIIPAKHEGEQSKKENLIELGGMAGNAVTKVHSPRKGGRCPIRIVGKTGEKATNAAYGNANAEGDREKVSGTGSNLFEAFDNLDGKPASKKSTDDGLATRQEEVSPG